MLVRSEALASKVKSMVVRGYKPALIARRLNITELELIEIYGRAIEIAVAERRVQATATVAKSAMKGDLASIAQILKTRAGWSESASRQAETQLPPLPPPDTTRYGEIRLPCNGRSGCPKATPRDRLTGLMEVWAEAVTKAKDAGFEPRDLLKKDS